MYIKRFSLLLIVIIDICDAQPTEKQVIPPSPNASAFAKYGNIPVSYYTGTLSISVPIYTIQVRDISVPVSLNYHTGGIKVSEEASRVGLGWSLSAGGLISRNIYNEDDFASHPNAWLSPLNISPQLPTGPGFSKPVLGVGSVLKFADATNPSNPKSLDLTDYIYGSLFDYEPDHFNFTFLEHSGKFIMGRDRVPVLERQQKISIVPDLNGETWEIKTADGFRYLFDASEYTVDDQAFGNQHKTAWYLTKIVSPLGETVTFNYITLPEQFIRPAGAYQQRAVPVSLSCSNFVCKTVNGKDSPLPRKIYSNIVLSSIAWKLGKVEFEMGSRDDLEGDFKVDRVKIYSRHPAAPEGDYQLRTQYQLDYTYFDYNVPGPVFTMPDVTAERLRKRLKLNAVRKRDATGSLQEWAYRFNYYESENRERLPAKNSYSRDHWGYYNGRLNTSLIPVYQQFTESQVPRDMIGAMGDERNPSADHMIAFALKEVVYPTGGKTTLLYESNDFDFKDEFPSSMAFPRWEQMLYDCIGNSCVLKSTLLDFRDQYINASGSAIPVEISAAFRSNQPCGTLAGVPSIYFEIVHEDGTLMKRVTLGMPACNGPDQMDCIYCAPGSGATGIFTYKGLINVGRGKYYWRAYSPAGERRFENISASIKWWVDARRQSPLDEDSKIAQAGGLRIARLDDYDPVTGQTNTRTFDYHFMADKDGDGQLEAHSYGKRMAVPRYSFFEAFWESKDMAPAGTATCLQCINLIRQSDSYVPATGTQGYAVGYDKVIEKRGLHGEGGWTEYEFHNEPDQPIEVNHPIANAEYPIRGPSISSIPDPLNGLQKSVTLFRSDGMPVRKESTTYWNKFTKLIYGLEYRRISALNFTLFDFIKVYENFGLNSDLMTLTYPSLRSSLIVPSITTETYFDSTGNQALNRVSKSFYDNAVHLQRTSSTEYTSDGRTLSTSYKYPADYSDGESNEAISTMKGIGHFHNIPLDITVTDLSVAEDIKILSTDLTLFGNFNNRLLPKETAVLDNATPLKAPIVPRYTPAAGYVEPIFRKASAMAYSANGNLQNVARNNDHDVSYQWGYNETLLVAEVRNAKNTLLKVPQTTPSTGSLAVSMGGSGTTISKTFNFTVDYTGAVFLKLGVPGSPQYTTTAEFSGVAIGTVPLSTNSCGATVIPFSIVPPGNYQLSVTIRASGQGVGACGEINYPKNVTTSTTNGFAEFFYEGFEEVNNAVDNPIAAHTGRRYWPGDYTLNFTPPNSRLYKIEYWYLDGNTWTYVARPYPGPTMLLTEGTAIDDVRLYPVDAHMRTYTYDPGVGMTSTILESGKTVTYEYDDFGRLAAIRNDNRSIEKAFLYSYKSN